MKLPLALLGFSVLALCYVPRPVCAQDAPAADSGKATFEKVCGRCHCLNVITGLKHTKPEWKAVVDTMAAYGAGAAVTFTDEELDAVVTYLARN